jgi:hypothetical protein
LCTKFQLNPILFREIPTFAEWHCFEFPLGPSFFTLPSLPTQVFPVICVPLFPYLGLCTSHIQINTGAAQRFVHINGMFQGTNKPLFAVQYSDTDFQQLL